MSDSIIKVEGLGKKYLIGHEAPERYTALRDVLVNNAKNWGRGMKQMFQKGNGAMITGDSIEEFWALKDVSFEIKKGEAVGIIGRNGAGKSTLLKVLSRITEPSSGRIEMHGRVASLLEVGTGFHPELTGRENIFLNGAILGMSRAEIKKKFDEIVDFSGVDKFLDTPVKRYSSGMYVRLAFAVAAHLEPEILVVDEVLAVGDAEFQKKCLGKMSDVSQNEGRTVLFVSHNLESMLKLCPKSLLMSNGKLLNFASTEKIIDEYLKSYNSLISKIEYAKPKAPGSEIVILLSSEVVNQDGRNVSNVSPTNPIGVRIKFEILKSSSDIILGLNLYNQMDVHILSSHQNKRLQNYKLGIYETVVWLPQNLLAEGIYYLGVAAMSYKPFHVHFHDNKKISFNVIFENNGLSDYSGTIPGVVRPILDWGNITNGIQ